MTTISFIIPTLARPTLHRAVRSVYESMGPEDECVIVGDGVTEEAIRNVGGLPLAVDPRFRIFVTEPTRCWGAHQYDVGMAHARGDWAAFLPDDDMLAPGAPKAIREAVEGTSHSVHVFRAKMSHWGGRVLGGSVRCCEVTASQLVIPTIMNRLFLLNEVCSIPPVGDPIPMPHWADNKTQTFDHAYITAILAWYGESPQFHDCITSLADQQNNGRVF